MATHEGHFGNISYCVVFSSSGKIEVANRLTCTALCASMSRSCTSSAPLPKRAIYQAIWEFHRPLSGSHRLKLANIP